MGLTTASCRPWNEVTPPCSAGVGSGDRAVLLTASSAPSFSFRLWRRRPCWLADALQNTPSQQEAPDRILHFTAVLPVVVLVSPLPSPRPLEGAPGCFHVDEGEGHTSTPFLQPLFLILPSSPAAPPPFSPIQSINHHFPLPALMSIPLPSHSV